MKTTKQSIMTSLVALLVLISMFVGTTFAWFTDIVTSKDNVIQAGMLDANMYWSKELLDADSDQWIDASAGPVFNHELWEPGYTQVRYVKVQNDGNLNFKWMLSLAADGKVTELSDVIDVYYIESPTAAIDSLDGLTSKGNLTDVLEGNISCEGSLKPDESCILAIAFHMDELAGNEYQGMTLCEAGFSLKLIATQATGEFDSFDDQYDSNAEWPYVAINYSVAESVAEKIDTTGNLTEDVKIGEAGDLVSAEVPAGVKLADGADKLTLKVESIETPNKSVPVANGESAQSVDVHIDGLDENNTVPVAITLKELFKPSLNTTSVKLYHIEDGAPVAMTLVSNPVNHNEFSYDPATGDVVMTVSSFSEYVPVTDNKNLWKGNFDISWYNTTDKEFTLKTADQLAGFGAIVDGGGEYTNKDGTKVNVPSDMFEGKTVYLGADIDLAGGVSLNPIGSGYVNGTSNSGGGEGRSFKGTFDGGKYDAEGNLVGVHTIRYLYQNGWDLGLSYCNLGGGLFGSVCNATIKNLNMVDAEIIMECVEQGVIAGLAQGNCTFENIAISNCSVANYQKATGGVVGEVSWGTDESENAVFTHTFRNIRIDNKTVVGSLWGDFDAPVGGVIGARWDDSNRTKVVMENVEVACRLDVYNDVTSTYQWYAYRRAGMLIGNTEQVANDGRTAAATFLTCSNVKVYYGDWVDYHYCEFNNHNSSWPFVRVEAGENCTAYSNPRYGVPNDPVTGKPVTNLDHNHTNGDDHNIELKFNQLYGGGQGVYGQPEHDGVTVVDYVYTITYINDYQVLYVDYVNETRAAQGVTVGNESAKKLVIEWAKQNIGVEGQDFVFNNKWMNAGSTIITAIDKDNDEDITLYPYFNSPHTARFVDQEGNVLSWMMFHADNIDDLRALADSSEARLPNLGDDFTMDKWEVHITDENGNTTSTADFETFDFANCKTDVTIYPVYKFNGDVSLIPVDSDGDGDTDYYQVAGYGADTGEQELVEIPGVVNGVPVTTINADAFSSYDDLHSVRIPGTITEISSQSFTADNPNQWGDQRDTVTLYWEGDPATWNAAMQKYNSGDKTGMLKDNWDNMMGESSCVFFLDENGKVDLSKGYWELANTKKWYEIKDKFVWQYHSHPYGSNSGCSNEHNNSTNYSGNCDCDSCNGAIRPDVEYWTPVATTEEN